MEVKQLIIEIQQCEKYINDYQKIINPCPMCSHYEKEIYDYDCSECSYFYASHFELKSTQCVSREGVKHKII